MKYQSTKKLFAFIIIMMFSISFLRAQCKGNEVLMHHVGGARGCSHICVPAKKVSKYLSMGWRYGDCYNCCGIGQSHNKTQKRAQKKSDDNALLSKR